MARPARYHLAGERFDVDRGPDAGPPPRSYVVCSTPRTGSSLLTEALAGTGVVGTPVEYFDRSSAHADLRDRWGCDDLACFVRCLHRFRTGPGDALGVKVHWFQLADVAGELGHSPAGPPTYRRERDTLERVAPGARLVHVTRRDRDRQAVSWAVARATARWAQRPGEAGADRPAVGPEEVDRCRRDIDNSEAGWAGLFAAARVEPEVVVYEDLAADYEATVRRVAASLGAPAVDVPPPPLVRQADARTEDLLARYRAWRARA